MIDNIDISHILHKFNLKGQPVRLSGGTQPAYRIGDAVLKRVEAESLENNHSLELVEWENCSEKMAAEMIIEYVSG